MKIREIAYALILLSIASSYVACSNEQEIQKPTIVTLTIVSITEGSATSGGWISSDNGSPITDRGLCWSTKPNPTLADSIFKDNGIGTGTFEINLTKLNASTTYYIRAFATNKGGTAYGDEKTFTTMSLALTTISPTFVMATSAISGGLVAFDSNSPDVISRGVCWNTFPFPTTSDSLTLEVAGKGSFSSTLVGLKPSTTYYVRAYLTNKNGTVYGNEFSFTTQNGLIGLSTDAASSITRTSANVAGTISGDGGSNITERGFYWSTSANPTISGQKIVIGNGTGNFSKDMTNLTPNTTYYYCAFATNSIGTVFSNEDSFTTLVGVPKACFDYSISKMYNASFTNCSDYPTSCIWDFGDGTTSTEKEPTHVYGTLGVYNVKLTVSNDGLTDLVTKTISITDEVSLNNFTISSWGPSAYIDVDLDGAFDFDISPQSFQAVKSGQYIYNTYIKPRNKYEFFSDSIYLTVTQALFLGSTTSTVKFYIPKIYYFGDTIRISNTRMIGQTNFCCSQTQQPGQNYLLNNWIRDEVRYVGFCKVVGNTTQIGWIKLKILGYTSAVLISFKLPTDGESLVISN